MEQKLNNKQLQQQMQSTLVQHQIHLETISTLGKLITPQSNPNFILYVESILEDLIKPFKTPSPIDVN